MDLLRQVLSRESSETEFLSTASPWGLNHALSIDCPRDHKNWSIQQFSLWLNLVRLDHVQKCWTLAHPLLLTGPLTGVHRAPEKIDDTGKW